MPDYVGGGKTSNATAIIGSVAIVIVMLGGLLVLPWMQQRYERNHAEEILAEYTSNCAKVGGIITSWDKRLPFGGKSIVYKCSQGGFPELEQFQG